MLSNENLSWDFFYINDKEGSIEFKTSSAMMHDLNWAQVPYLSIELGYFVFRRIMRLHCEFTCQS